MPCPMAGQMSRAMDAAALADPNVAVSALGCLSAMCLGTGVTRTNLHYHSDRSQDSRFVSRQAVIEDLFPLLQVQGGHDPLTGLPVGLPREDGRWPIRPHDVRFSFETTRPHSLSAVGTFALVRRSGLARDGVMCVFRPDFPCRSSHPQLQQRPIISVLRLRPEAICVRLTITQCCTVLISDKSSACILASYADAGSRRICAISRTNGATRS